MICSAPVGRLTIPVLLAMVIPYSPSIQMGVLETPKRTTQWLENGDIIDYLAVICKGDFQLFFIFFIASVCAVLWLVLLVILYVCVIAQRARVFVVMAFLYR